MTEIVDTLDNIDPGDDVFKRYRYQCAYGIILLAASVMEELDYKAIWCEQHEDILGEVNESCFDAYQIKTKKPELGCWKTNDIKLKDSIKKFVKIDADFPNTIRKFIFVSNATYFESGSDNDLYKCPITIITKICSVNNYNELRNSEKQAFELFLDHCQCTPEQLFTVLKRVVFQVGPGLNSFDSEIAHIHLSKLPNCAEFNANNLSNLRDHLVTKIFKASSLYCDDPSMHFICLKHEKQKEPLLRAKRISVEDIDIITKGLGINTFRYITIDNSLNLGNYTGSLSILKAKMGKGDLSSHFETMRIRALSAESNLWDLLTRPDVDENMLSQLISVVQIQSNEAKLRASQSGEPYGQKMLIEFGNRIDYLCKHDPNLVCKQHPELLMGLAGLLSEDCKIWWSPEFEMEIL